MNLPTNQAVKDFLQNVFNTNKNFSQKHDVDFFAQFKDQQTPQLTVLKCSDSRVQLESFYEAPQNGVFAIRNIGNQIQNALGSVDFGVTVLKTPFLMILGHSNCGAVDAVIQGSSDVSDAIKKELLPLKITHKTNQQGVIENVNNQVGFAVARYQKLIKDDKLTIFGAIYDFKNEYGLGHGKLILLNVNGCDNRDDIRDLYGETVPSINHL